MTAEPLNSIPSGSTIGIIGGGQLGRMTAIAAANLGYHCHIFCPEERCPASKVSAEFTQAEYTDHEALARFADSVDVVTFEFENIPHESVQLLTEHVLVRPNWDALKISQDRLIEKDFLNQNGISTASYKRATSAEDLKTAVAEIGTPSVLKTVRLGYDGKGQVKVTEDTNLDEAWSTMGSELGVLEGFVPFEREISVIVARAPSGECRAFEPVHNVHTNHILDTTTAPAGISPQLRDKAIAMAEQVATALDIIGLLAVEMFVTNEDDLLVNEIAPRPHNSGHWTMDGCATSQFEQFVRAICGLPLGSTERLHNTVMTNLIGDDVNDWEEILTEPNAHLHLYGKREARTGRKMGHVNRLFPKT
ncbi:MAG: 5-(carboxyamino)imidazole ribonucleotide synthase [Rhodospirillales bacterium]|nr:5-(carboxyamino)imidazole ribonucleotide synthase [Rhodospirillales bacterium]